MMDERQKVGGISALIGAATVVMGLGMFATVLSDYAAGEATPDESVAFLASHEVTIFVWNLITLIVFSIVLVPLALALYERLKSGSPAMAQTATAFGLIWAGLLIAAGMILNIGFGTDVDVSPSQEWTTDSAGIEAPPRSDQRDEGLRIGRIARQHAVNRVEVRAGYQFATNTSPPSSGPAW